MGDIRYVTQRRTSAGNVLYYWQRKPFPLTKLSDDPIERELAATELNSLADEIDRRRKAHPENIEGTVAWCVKKYRESQKFTGLAEGTRNYYSRHLDNIVQVYGALPIKEFTRKQLVDFIEAHTESQHRHIAAAVSKVFKVGQRHDFVEVNPAVQLDLSSGTPREAIWEARDIVAYIQAAKQHEHCRPLVVAFFAMLFTAQRPSDVLALKRERIGEHSIVIRQKKTMAWVEIPVHKLFRPVLEFAYEVGSEYLVCGEDGAPVSPSSFRLWTLAVRTAVGLMHLQMRDLRRTSIVIMGEAGVPVPHIAAISGHSIATVEHMMRVYMPRTKLMAEAAIKTWESAGSARLIGVNTKEL